MLLFRTIDVFINDESPLHSKHNLSNFKATLGSQSCELCNVNLT